MSSETKGSTTLRGNNCPSLTDRTSRTPLSLPTYSYPAPSSVVPSFPGDRLPSPVAGKLAFFFSRVPSVCCLTPSCSHDSIHSVQTRHRLLRPDPPDSVFSRRDPLADLNFFLACAVFFCRLKHGADSLVRSKSFAASRPRADRGTEREEGRRRSKQQRN